MKPKAGTIRHRIPNLDESDYIWLRDRFLEVVGEDESRQDTLRLQPTTAVFERNNVRQEIRTHIKELFEETK